MTGEQMNTDINVHVHNPGMTMYLANADVIVTTETFIPVQITGK